MPSQKLIHIFLQRHTLLFCLFIQSFFTFQASAFANTSLTVGVYNNEPTIFTNSQGQSDGIFIDLLEEIAAREGWEITYKTGHFNELFDQLKSGEIDLLPAVAYSKQREAYIDYNYTTVLANWAELYTDNT